MRAVVGSVRITLKPSRFQALLLIGILFGNVPAIGAEAIPGKAIYLRQCASCHGEHGQGVEQVYATPLTGELSRKGLVEYISKTMPEGEPDLCTGEEAQQVAEYIYDQFYSFAAQSRNQPARIRTSRLTVPQYRQSLADLILDSPATDLRCSPNGLRSEYYDTNRRALRRLKDKHLKIERIDPQVDFDFGNQSADPERIPPTQYCVYWYGSLLVPETGHYDFILKTPNAGRLWINHTVTDGASGEYGGSDPVVDAVVRSENSDEYRGSRFLLGGRVYPIQVEFNKSSAEQTGRFQLKWKPPGGEETVIPSQYLFHADAQQVIVVSTPFPPDDRSSGYERGIRVSREWNEAVKNGAVEYADEVMSRIYELAPLADDAPDQHAQQLYAFSERFLERAFRRPLSPEIRQHYLTRQFEQTEDPLVATKRMILLALRSPRFLFPGMGEAEFDDFRTAEWLALSLWDSLPDDELTQAAVTGKLNTEAQITAQVQRMISDERSRAKVRSFFHHWLTSSIPAPSKSSDRFPDFNQRLASDLRVSLDLLVEEIFWSDSSSYKELLTTDRFYMNGRMANYYGAEFDLENDAAEQFVRRPLDPQQRAGIVTHPYLLAGLAYHDSSSPIHRGVFLARSLVGRKLKPPPIGVELEPADLHPELTTRERVAHQTSSPNCSTCHGVINPLGFALEHFDADGRYRTRDCNKPVDATAVYVTREGDEHTIHSAKHLAEYFAHSEECHRTFVEHLFQYTVKQPIAAFPPDVAHNLTRHFQDSHLHMRKLLISIAVESALQARALSVSEATEKADSVSKATSD